MAFSPLPQQLCYETAQRTISRLNKRYLQISDRGSTNYYLLSTIH